VLADDRGHLGGDVLLDEHQVNGAAGHGFAQPRGGAVLRHQQAQHLAFDGGLGGGGLRVGEAFAPGRVGRA